MEEIDHVLISRDTKEPADRTIGALPNGGVNGELAQVCRPV